jgi:putative PIN family toxin of toxin-antitoxin system
VGAEKIVVKRKPRVVFDTNVVVSALLFASGRLAWLRTAWSKGLVIPLVNRSTVDELLRVLAYPKFKLSSADREELLGDYLPFAELVPPGPRRAETQTCRDPHDRIFIELAIQAAADALVTGDADLLVLKHAHNCPILTPETFRTTLSLD